MESYLWIGAAIVAALLVGVWLGRSGEHRRQDRIARKGFDEHDKR